MALLSRSAFQVHFQCEFPTLFTPLPIDKWPIYERIRSASGRWDLVRPALIVIDAPSLDLVLRVVKRFEPVYVQAFVTQ